VPNQPLKTRIVDHLLPRVQTPAQYIGGEWNSVVKDHRAVRGTLCLAFPDAYAIGMSHCGLQVLYDVMNRRADWACERAFAPMTDMEQLLREHGLPLYSLETFTPLHRFDVLGFTLQYDLCYTNVLTMLDLGGIPLAAEARTAEHPLVVAGGPCTANPEPMSRFIDLFVIGDGEEALPELCNLWIDLKRASLPRNAMLAEMAARLPFAYAPRFHRGAGFQPVGDETGLQSVADRIASSPTTGWKPVATDKTGCWKPAATDCIQPAVVDLDAFPPPAAPIVPFIECVHDRIAIEIMRGCPGRCRFCQSTTLKRPLRFRSIDAIVEAAMTQYRNTGYNEISLLSLSTSDYPQFDELMRRLHETFRPLGVAVSLPSLRINEQLRLLGDLVHTDRHSGLTLAPEAARDATRRRIGKPISNDDLYAGCRRAFENGFSRVKLYFLCGLPGEEEADLAGILEMAETISRLGREVGGPAASGRKNQCGTAAPGRGRGQLATVVANVSNFVPKPQTPFQWHPMQTREYFRWAHEFLHRNKTLRSVQLKCHDIEASLLEGAMCRGDRRMGEAIELAWRRGARFDGWAEKLQPALWWKALADAGIDVEQVLHAPRSVADALPWDHIGIRQGRAYLERNSCLDGRSEEISHSE